MQLLQGQTSEQIGIRRWTVVLKVVGAKTLPNLRDIQVCNECRQVSARILNKGHRRGCQRSLQLSATSFRRGPRHPDQQRHLSAKRNVCVSVCLCCMPRQPAFRYVLVCRYYILSSSSLLLCIDSSRALVLDQQESCMPRGLRMKLR